MASINVRRESLIYSHFAIYSPFQWWYCWSSILKFYFNLLFLLKLAMIDSGMYNLINWVISIRFQLFNVIWNNNLAMKIIENYLKPFNWLTSKYLHDVNVTAELYLYSQYYRNWITSVSINLAALNIFQFTITWIFQHLILKSMKTVCICKNYWFDCSTHDIARWKQYRMGKFDEDYFIADQVKDSLMKWKL